MALVQYGAGIVQMSGSIAGSTFARNRSGNYSRARTKPINPNSYGQVKMRAVVSFLCEYWEQDLSSAQRAAWGVYASTVAMKNKLGQAIYLSGFNHFIRTNSGRKFQHLSIVDAAPTNFTLADKDPTISIDVDESPQVITVTFDINMDWVSDTGAYMHLRQGLPQRGTRNYFMGPWRNVGLILGSGTPWTTPVPFTPVFAVASGQRQWCCFRICRSDGRLSEMFYANAIVHSQAPGEVPNVIGMLQADAETLITSPEVGLTVGTVTTENHPTIELNHVISSDPLAHTRLTLGDPVNLVVSLGPAA